MKYLFPIIIAVILFSTVLFADVIYVPEDYPTIQGAINAAQPGDTIQVGPGIYAPASAGYLNDISLFGSGMEGPDNTIIQNSTLSGISVNYSNDWVIRGFEICNVFQGVRLQYCTNVEVSEIYAHDNNISYSVGISITGCSDVYYHHNIIESNGYS